MRDFFGPGGLLEQRLPDYEFRPSQVRMAETVYAALEQQNHVIIEAGTGTGKTLAYLLPALIHGRRVLVSTGTKTLQDQIFYKDIPLLESVIGRTIRAAYLKGRNNYLCRIKLAALQIDDVTVVPSEQLIAAITGKRYGDMLPCQTGYVVRRNHGGIAERLFQHARQVFDRLRDIRLDDQFMMIGRKMLRHLPREVGLVEILLRETNGERLDRTGSGTRH